MPELLFPFNHIPIARTIWEEHPTYNQELISFIKDFDNQNKIDPKKIVAGQIKHNVSESSPRLDFFKKANIKPINKFVTFIEEAIIELYYELWNLQTVAKSSPIKGKTVIHESWYHITSYGGYHDYHDHYSSNCHLCGIYYLRLRDPELKTDFLNTPELAVEEGDILFFDSHAPHRSPPNHTKHDKIILAFNLELS